MRQWGRTRLGLHNILSKELLLSQDTGQGSWRLKVAIVDGCPCLSWHDVNPTVTPSIYPKSVFEHKRKRVTCGAPRRRKRPSPYVSLRSLLLCLQAAIRFLFLIYTADLMDWRWRS